jgi:hypothetical protein
MMTTSNGFSTLSRPCRVSLHATVQISDEAKARFKRLQKYPDNGGKEGYRPRNAEDNKPEKSKAGIGSHDKRCFGGLMSCKVGVMFDVV